MQHELRKCINYFYFDQYIYIQIQILNIFENCIWK